MMAPPLMGFCSVLVNSIPPPRQSFIQALIGVSSSILGDVFRCGIVIIIDLKALATDKVDDFRSAMEDVGIDGISLKCLARSSGRSS